MTCPPPTVLAATVMALALAGHAGAQESAQPGAPLPQGLVREPTAHTATRLLVARSGKLDRLGWIEAESTFSPGEGMTYRIVREGGDKRIRQRVLRKVLDSEVAMSAPDAAPRFALSSDNYRLQPGAGGRVRLTPLRREPALVDGVAVVGADGQLSTVEGRLARSPSFWVRSVRVSRTYRQVGGHALPVHVESVADVRFAGPCEFSMWIDYTTVDGLPVTRAVARRVPPASAASSLLVAWHLRADR